MIGKSSQSKDQGTALMAALLLVAMMAAVSVQLVDMARFAVFRTSHIDIRSETYWQALGAREFAESVVTRGLEGSVMRADLPWLNEPQVFAADNALISGTISDANNCFNINTLALGPSDEDDPEAQNALQRHRERFDILMDRIGAPPGQASNLKAQIIDWIDRDTRPEAGGAEDEAYQRFDPPYRAANRPMAELDELMALPAMTADFYAFLEPWLCVLPTSGQPPLNLNTLRLEQAPLLAAAFSQRLDVSDAERVLFRRPPQGYDALEGFFADPVIEQLELDGADQSAVTLRSSWFAMVISVRSEQARFTVRQLAEVDESGRVVRHQQRCGPF